MAIIRDNNSLVDWHLLASMQGIIFTLILANYGYATTNKNSMKKEKRRFHQFLGI
jgi:hypothetical protein